MLAVARPFRCPARFADPGGAQTRGVCPLFGGLGCTWQASNGRREYAFATFLHAIQNRAEQLSIRGAELGELLSEGLCCDVSVRRLLSWGVPIRQQRIELKKW